MAKLKGKDLTLFVHDGTKYTAFAFATSCELEVHAEVIPTLSTTEWGWETSTAGMKGWTMDSECFANRVDNPLNLLGETVKVMIGSVPDYDIPGPRLADGKMRRYGEAVITEIRETGELKGMAIYAMSLQGSGELKHDPNPQQHGKLWMSGDLWMNSDLWIEK